MIEIIRDSIVSQSLATVWNTLADPFQTPLLRHEWFAACAEVYCPADQLRVVINKSPRGIVAIAPLALAQYRSLEVIEILGTSSLFEQGGFIYKDEEALEELVVTTISMGKPAHLSRLRSASLEVSLLQKMNLKGSCIIVRDSAGSYFLPVTTSWAEFEFRMSSRHRYDLGRARKRAEKFGQVQYEIVSPGLDVLDNYLEEIFQVEAAGWKGRSGTAMLFDERMKRFFQIYSRAACHMGTLRLCYLRINGRPVAVLLAVEYYNRFWVLKIGYDEVFSKCSPGLLLIHETVHHAFEQGLEAYEFLGSVEPWIHIWTEQQHPFVTARIYPFSISGQLSLGIDAISALSNKALKLVGK